MTFLETQLIYPVFLDFLFISHIHDHLYKLTQHINALHFSLKAVLCGHMISYSGKSAVQFLIGLLLMLQAAHQSSAYP